MRSLSPDEAALWAQVAATIRPLSRDSNGAQAAAETHEIRAPAMIKRPLPRPPAQPRRAAPGATLDGSWDRRLSSGAVEPDRVVDLHGMNLDEAWRAIDQALEHAVAQGERIVLLITGHQRAGEPPIRRGAIRAAVHDWLAASRHAGRIAAVRPAHRRHGGGGSLYLVMRRNSARR